MTRMYALMFGLSLGFGGVILLTQAAAAAAQGAGRQCAPRAAMIDRLQEDFGETRRALGLAGPQAMMELYASDDTGTWTIAMTLPDGRMCLVAAGRGFEALAAMHPARGAPL